MEIRCDFLWPFSLSFWQPCLRWECVNKFSWKEYNFQEEYNMKGTFVHLLARQLQSWNRNFSLFQPRNLRGRVASLKRRSRHFCLLVGHQGPGGRCLPQVGKRTSYSTGPCGPSWKSLLIHFKVKWHFIMIWVNAINLDKRAYNSINSVFATLFWVHLLKASCIFLTFYFVLASSQLIVLW